MSIRRAIALSGLILVSAAPFVARADATDKATDACIAASDQSELARQFRYRLFSKIVPNVKSLGLLSPRQRERFEKLGILEYEHGSTSDVDHDAEIERRVREGELPAPQ